MLYKIEAVKLSMEIRNSKAAKELGVPKSTLSQWANQADVGEIDTGACTQTGRIIVSSAFKHKKIRIPPAKILLTDKLNAFKIYLRA